MEATDGEKDNRQARRKVYRRPAYGDAIRGLPQPERQRGEVTERPRVPVQRQQQR